MPSNDFYKSYSFLLFSLDVLNSTIVDNSINFSWYPLEGAKNYKFIIKNSNDKVVYTK